MNMREQTDRIRIHKQNRLYGLNWIVVGFVTLVVALVLAFGVQAIQNARRTGAGAVLRVPSDFPNMQAAINAANPGDIVQVGAGVYTEHIVLSKPVSLIAESFDEINPANNTAVLDGGGSGTVIL